MKTRAILASRADRAREFVRNVQLGHTEFHVKTTAVRTVSPQKMTSKAVMFIQVRATLLPAYQDTMAPTV